MRYVFLLLLITIGLFENAYDLYFYRRIGPFDLLVFLSFLYFQFKYKTPAFLKSISFWFFVFITVVVAVGLITYEFNLTGGFIHYTRNLLMTLVGFYLGFKISNNPKFEKPGLVFYLIPFFILFFQQIKFGSIGLDALGAFDLSKIDREYENIGFFQWNNMSAVASLSLFLLFISKKKYNYINAVLIFTSLTIIIIAVSRTAFTTLGIFLLAFVTLRRKEIPKFFIFLLMLLAVGAFFWPEIIGFYENRYSPFFEQKMVGYQNDLVDIRWQTIFVSQMKDWLNSADEFWFGQKDVWGHSFLVTIALKSGIVSLILAIIYFFQLFRTAFYIGAKENRYLYAIFFFTIILQMFVADYAFTSTYYAFISFLILGYLNGHLIKPK